MDDRRETPVFVKLTEYRDLTDIVNLAREQIQKAKAVLNRVHDLKAQEDTILESWQNEMSDMESKVEDIDKRLLEPEL